MTSRKTPAGRFCGVTNNKLLGGISRMQSLQAVGDSLWTAADRFLATPDEALFTADIVVADWKVRLRSTCRRTAELYSQRLQARNPVASDDKARLTLTLLEIGVPGCIYVGAPETCVFDPYQQRGVQLVSNTDDLPPWHSGAPLRILLHLAAVNRGWSLVH